MISILVTGTARWYERLPQRAARMVGVTLAQAGIRLVTGNATGVDRWVAESFCSEIVRRGLDAAKYYRQLYLPYWDRGSLWPLPGFSAPTDSKIILKKKFAWDEEAISRCDAAIMIGGRWGALRIARRFIDAGKTVFPIPFTGGRSNEVFQDILRTWCESPVPGLSRSQFLTLASPWISGTGPLANLLFATFAEETEIFISYRRTDSETAVGRLYRDLAEYFGVKRVFVDLQDIAPSDVWSEEIERALQSCRVGIVVIGPRWAGSRLNQENDVLRNEVAKLLDLNKIVLPVLIEGASLPDSQSLPDDLAALRNHQARVLDNTNWKPIVDELIRIIERDLNKTRGGALTVPGAKESQPPQ